MCQSSTLFAILLALLSASLPLNGEGAERADLPDLTETKINSTLDGTEQPALFWAPSSASDEPTPLLVFLHSWSGNYRQNNWTWHAEAVQRGWLFVHPNFRGPNKRPEACGSDLARRDVLDCIDFVNSHYNVDSSRVYLAGVSGGGHMAMLMAGYYPQRFSAVSAWVGISDLADWYQFHVRDGQPQNYARMVSASCGGAPGMSPEVDAAYKARSPLFHLHQVGDLPLDLYAGIRDGHTGSVPIRHTLRAFNVVAESLDAIKVAQEKMDSLAEQGRSMAKQPVDATAQGELGRQMYLRRHAGQTRVTIFDGGHEGLPGPACDWLATQKRTTAK